MKRIGYKGWWVVGASVTGLMCSSGPINIFTFGVFLRAMSDDMHIGRGTFGAAMLVTNWISTFSGPVVGLMLDKWGGRPVILTGIVLFAFATAAQSLMSPSLVVIFLFFAMKGLAGAGASPFSYGFVVAKWFDRRRGLALGVALAGVGLGTSVVPPIAAYLIDHYGWRTAYVGLGGVILVLAGIPVARLLFEPNERERAQHAEIPRGAAPGLTVREAMAGWRFWGLAFAFLLGVVALNGTLTQIVAMLVDRGVPLQSATRVLAVSGIASLCGRITSGWLVDRLHGPYVAVGFFILPMIGTALFGSGAGGAVPYLGAIFCGAALGGEIDLMGFFISRYFGLKSYGTLFGTIFGVFAGATGVGPFLSGRSFDAYHSYIPAFAFYEVILVIACLIFLPLGAYPYPAQHRAAPASGDDKVPA